MRKQANINNPNLRKSNFELLRIIAMTMIIAHHVAVHSGFSFASDSISVNRLWIQLIEMGGKIGVNIFVLISGYFMITANSIKTTKVINLWLQIFTYSFGFFLAVALLSPDSFSMDALIKSAMPITFSKWWFASTYFVLYLISPYVNKLLNSFDKKQYQRFLALLLFCWCIIPTLLSKSWQSSDLLWFVFLYALAGYVRLYTDIRSIKRSTCILLTVIIIALTFLSVIALDILGTKNAFAAKYATYFYGMSKLPVLLISLLLFLGFATTNIGCIPLVNAIASTCFGIYLIHDNNYVRLVLWNMIFHNTRFQESSFLIPYTLLQVVIVFVACGIVELLRIHLIERAYSKLVGNMSKWANGKLEKIFSHKIFEKF